MPSDESSVKVKGEWNQPPLYPNLTTAITEGIAKTQTYVFEAFFGPGKLEKRPTLASPLSLETHDA